MYLLAKHELRDECHRGGESDFGVDVGSVEQKNPSIVRLRENDALCSHVIVILLGQIPLLPGKTIAMEFIISLC